MGPRWHRVRYVIAITKKRFLALNRKKKRAFPTVPGLAGISSEVIQSHWTKALLRKENKNVSFS
jgi:hypothetical protein